MIEWLVGKISYAVGYVEGFFKGLYDGLTGKKEDI